MHLTPSKFKTIGSALYNIDPDFAMKILEKTENNQPREGDIKKIPAYFDKFCALKNIDGINSKTHRQGEYVYLRYVFMGVIIRLYNPELFSSIHTCRMKRTLRIALAKAMKTHVTWVSQATGIVLVRYRAYEGFQNDVIETIAAIK